MHAFPLAGDGDFNLQVAQTIREQGLNVAQVCRKQKLAKYNVEQTGQAGIGELQRENQRRCEHMPLLESIALLLPRQLV
ncbi:hypothetical protein ABB27_12900 [Stenotrophomonas terrae]|uniref:Uncharacterized protein n=1 Tax=Stenotrophomonas terrae TaxID=405446 RepID=A0A0R0CM25_9GAMM|nr:hypothetical protein [Stenotrophomonas terrae]KRG66743.1 hypothetical protein ABB27_12900 [Stenotrophomonas terrae]